MASRINPYLVVLLATIILASACRPVSPNANDGAAAWKTLQTGKFTTDNVFYSQFGAAPFDIALHAATDSIVPGVLIRYRVFSEDMQTVLFTALMEKLPAASGLEGDWRFSALDQNNRPQETGTGCVDCHRQQANNNYLFTIPKPVSAVTRQ